MKRRLGAFGAAAITIALLGGCSLIGGGGDAPRTFVSTGEVDVADGSYATIRVSDDTWNAEARELEKRFDGIVQVANVDGSDNSYGETPQNAFPWLRDFFYTEWINSTALEGSVDDRAAWNQRMMETGVFADTEFTRAWLAGPTESYSSLTLDNLHTRATISGLVHDGGARMDRADFALDTVEWADTVDGPVLVLGTTWSVDYRVTDQTVVDYVMQDSGVSEDGARNALKPEVLDGDGVNVLPTSGTTSWFVRPTFDADVQYELYAVEHVTTATTIADLVKPEFNTPAATDAP